MRFAVVGLMVIVLVLIGVVLSKHTRIGTVEFPEGFLPDKHNEIKFVYTLDGIEYNGVVALTESEGDVVIWSSIPPPYQTEVEEKILNEYWK